jgi:uracil-DNA glycosylase family 4
MTTPIQEFQTVISQLKHLLKVDMEMGLDPPSLSSGVLDYLNKAPKQGICPSSMDELKRLLIDCNRCQRSRYRTNLVFGEGPSDARLVFMAYEPSDEDDRTGKPFTGEGGHLLTRIIENGMGVSRNMVYVCHIMKCRSPDEQAFHPDEMETCMPFLKQQLRIIQPEVICVLGQGASQGLLGRDFKLFQNRGRWHSFMGIPVMPTFSPAYILENPSKERELKGLVWKDIQMIMTRLGLEARHNV